MSELVELFNKEDESINVVERLESSASSGRYWYMLGSNGLETEWGLNSSPYNPLFSVTTHRMYHLRVLEGLEKFLTTLDVNINVQEGTYAPVIVPVSKAADIQDFLMEFDDPIILAVGRYSLTPENVANWLFARVKDFYVFDRAKTIWDWKRRNDVIDDIVLEFEYSDIKVAQGSLRYKKTFVGSSSATFSKGMEPIKHITVANHLIQIIRGSGALGIQCDERAVIVAPSEGGRIEFSIFSYEHDIASWFKLDPGEAILFKHGEGSFNRARRYEGR